MVASVNLDLLPLKRVLAIEEAGTEHLPPERTPEEKSRFLLQRIDFEQSEEKDAKKAKSNKEAISQSTLKWPWQGLVENLQLAHQELSYILDFLTHVEGNEAITVASMVKPKQLLHEACSELALRAAAKLHNFKKVGKYLKQTAKALEQQVDREAVFYGALMRLQQHWKVKRLRGISAGPGGNAGFTIDLSYPQMSAEMMSGLSIRSAGLYSVNVEQDSSGLLMADLPGHCINTLHMRFSGPYTPHNGLKDELAKEDSTVLSSHEMKSELENKCTEKKARVTTEKDVGEAVNTGANAAHSVLRRIQTAIIDEQIFEWTVREALQPSSGLVVTGIEESSLQISLGHSCALVLELSKAMEGNPDTQNTDPKIAEIDGHGARKFKVEAQGLESNHDEINSAECNPKAEHRSPQSKGACTNFRKDMSAFVCLQQAFYYSAFVHPQELESSSYPAPKPGQMKSVDGASLLSKPRDSGAGVWQDSLVVEAVGPLKHFSLTMRHRVFSSRVLSELEKLVRGVPYLFLSFHPTWSSRVTTWELRLEIPQPIVEGWKMSMVSWREAQKKTRSKFYLKVILCDALLFVEGLEAMHMQEGASLEEWKRSKHRCDLTELSGFLLYQLAGQLVKWLYEEALVMGLKVRRNLLSIFFHISSKDDYVVLASLDIQAYCINWWLQLLGPEGEDKQELASSKSHSRRFLGPLNLETLRGVLVDLLNSCSDDLEKVVF